MTILWMKLTPLSENLKLLSQELKPLLNDIQKQFVVMIEFACEYIATHMLHYQSVWWRLLNSPQKKDWGSVLVLAELLFSLPVSNVKVQRVFSTANVIKTEKRTALANSLLHG